MNTLNKNTKLPYLSDDEIQAMFNKDVAKMVKLGWNTKEEAEARWINAFNMFQNNEVTTSMETFKSFEEGIANGLCKANYDNSPLKMAVHNAKGIFNSLNNQAIQF